MGAWAGRPGATATRRARDQLARGRALRTTRGGLLGVLSVGLSSAAHAGAGGHVSVAMLVVLAVAGAAGFTALSDREWRLPRLVGALAAGQALLHVLLSTGGSHPAAGDAVHVGMTGGPAAPVAAIEHPVSSDPGVLPMLAAHAVALLVVALLVRQGEDLLLRAACALRAVARPLVDRLGTRPAIRPTGPLRLATGQRPIAQRPSVHLAHSVGRRGPPVPQPA